MKKTIKLSVVFFTIALGLQAQKPNDAKVKPVEVKDNSIKPSIASKVNPNVVDGIITKPVLNYQKPKLCVDKIYNAPGRNIQQPAGVNISPLTGESARLWPNGSTITVKFLGGSPLMRLKTIQYANEWSRYVNIRFRFVENSNADIKVRYNNDGSSWSMLGRVVKDIEALRAIGEVFAGEIATMNFGWFTDATSDEEFRRVILHEFGHALGFVHEHSHPEANIPWDREATYAAYAAPPNGWDRGKVDDQVFKKYSRNQTQFSNYDRMSIMQYPVPNELTVGDFEIPWNTSLSQADKDFSAIIYPRASDIVNKLRVTFKTGGDDLRVNSNAKLIVELSTGAVTKLEVSANGGRAYGEGSTNTGEINLPAGVNISNIVRCRLYFESGKQFESDGPDNWNIDEVKLEWVETRRENIEMSVVRGTPLIRMSNQSELVLFPR
jgi:serralysin